jgi:hypothetical protein
MAGHETCRNSAIAAVSPHFDYGVPMSLGAILLIVLILILIGVLPTWPYSASWGYAPTGLVGVVVLALVVLWALGRV